MRVSDSGSPPRLRAHAWPRARHHRRLQATPRWSRGPTWESPDISGCSSWRTVDFQLIRLSRYHRASPWSRSRSSDGGRSPCSGPIRRRPYHYSCGAICKHGGHDPGGIRFIARHATRPRLSTEDTNRSWLGISPRPPGRVRLHFCMTFIPFSVDEKNPPPGSRPRLSVYGSFASIPGPFHVHRVPPIMRP